MHDSKQQTFLKAYEACHDRFLRYCSTLAYGQMDVQDLVQDVLLSAYENFEKIEKKGQLIHYLIRAARNRSISIWRKRRDLIELADLHHQRLVDQGVSPETILDIELLYKMLKKLPVRQKDAVILFEISGFSIREIADIQQSTEGATKTRISRGRARLAVLLEDKSTQQLSEVWGTLKSISL
ncbi:RNA polymerase sigma factor [Roseivirga sp.]|uniref:RNA polymerase sigma factor n=1 Tax=Roseivirga sp. TaxID=1964215 RepID=UPI003B515768